LLLDVGDHATGEVVFGWVGVEEDLRGWSGFGGGARREDVEKGGFARSGAALKI
jgi:hypothetical protein